MTNYLFEKWPTLVRLVHFYDIDITDWVTWDDDEDDSESESDEDDSSKAPPKTERAVDLHQERAIEEVADELGLDYERIQATMSRADLYQAPVPTPSKRKQSPTTDAPRIIKPKYNSPPFAIQRVPTKELLENDKSFAKSQSSRAETIIYWQSNLTEETRTQPRFVAPRQSPNPKETMNLEGRSEGKLKASSKRSAGSTNQEKSEGSHRASSNRSEGSTVPIPSEERRAWENRSGR